MPPCLKAPRTHRLPDEVDKGPPVGHDSLIEGERRESCRVGELESWRVGERERERGREEVRERGRGGERERGREGW